MTGVRIEVFYADRSVETFGWRAAGSGAALARLLASPRSAIGPLTRAMPRTGTCWWLVNEPPTRLAGSKFLLDLHRQPAAWDPGRGIEHFSAFHASILLPARSPWKHRKG